MTSQPGSTCFPSRTGAAPAGCSRNGWPPWWTCDQWAERTVVLALPRGGVAVAGEVAEVLGVPMDVIVTRKIGYPPQPELGVGAIAEGLPQPVYDAGLLDRLGAARRRTCPRWSRPSEAELDRRVRIYRRRQAAARRSRAGA